ncbi:MAG TPA: PfkB family carbohydrate kinase [Pirellulales bacterium]|nr:PfkB family carbohydrate kinase [Pirellulales bacterium]
MLSLERLDSVLTTLPGLTIGLVGDLFLDRYLWLDPDLVETSIETGLEAYQITRVRNSPGALGTVMNNLAALGVGRLVPVTVLGDDGQAYDLLKELNKLPVDAGHIMQDPVRLTPTYTKPMRRDAAGTWRELNRIDLRNNAPLGRETEARLVEHLTDVFQSADGLAVLDQVNEENRGVMTTGVREHLASLCRADPDKIVLVDSRQRIGQFHFGLLKPNVGECLRSLGRDERSATGDLAFARDAAVALSRHTGRPLFCTVGESGMLAVGFKGPASVAHVPGCPVSGPIDIVGAGDSATAGILSALLSGGSATEAAALGNLVASVTVQQLGTTGTASPDQLRAGWRLMPDA